MCYGMKKTATQSANKLRGISPPGVAPPRSGHELTPKAKGILDNVATL